MNIRWREMWKSSSRHIRSKTGGKCAVTNTDEKIRNAITGFVTIPAMGSIGFLPPTGRRFPAAGPAGHAARAEVTRDQRRDAYRYARMFSEDVHRQNLRLSDRRHMMRQVCEEQD